MELVDSGGFVWMIRRNEIITIAAEAGLTPSMVEKDFVLGWLLAAINENPALSQSWVFKGGTCLKKCYVETYRYSEDLDFTLQDEAHISENFLVQQFTSIAMWLFKEAGIEMPADRFVFDIFSNRRGRQNCEVRAYFRSYFSKGKRSFPRIKIDLTADERLVLSPTQRPVLHPYTDAAEHGFNISSYDYIEVVAEKIRALGERANPRDLYDLVHLCRNDQLPPVTAVRDVLSEKCSYKRIDIPTLAHMNAHKSRMQRNWRPILTHQLPVLPDFDACWDGLHALFEWLEGPQAPDKPQLSTISEDGRVYQPLYGHLGLKALNGNSLEIIRFAAGNRLCIDLVYIGEGGCQSSGRIEPYSLREDRDGIMWLYAVRVDNDEVRPYRVDQIHDASLTDRVFIPRYEIELNSKNLFACSQHC